MTFSHPLPLALVLLNAPYFALAHGGDDHAHEEMSLEECYAITEDGYDMGLHIASIFIILVAGGLGVFGAMLLSRMRKMPPTLYSILTFGRHFGTGVILATAFIHMLPGSMSAFADPCASSFSNLYGSWGTLFAMIAALLMQLIEFLAGEMARSTTKGTLPPPGPSGPHDHHPPHTSPDLHHPGPHSLHNLPAQVTPEDTSSSDAHDRCSKDAVVLDTSTCKVVESGIPVHHHMGHSCHDPATMMDQGGRRISTYILELGIAIHSVLIGLALGTAGSDEFVALLVALVFHQFFEGVALGSRIGEVVKRHHLGRMLFMAATFALVTPLGTAIGIGIRSSYAPRSPTTLITQGVLDGLSAGVLIYTAFVSLMAEEFIHNEHFRSQNRRAKASAFTALYLGAALMALIGKWA